MGFLRPTALIVTGLYEVSEGAHWAEVARAKALEVFGRDRGQVAVSDLSLLSMVGELSPDLWNGVRSFAVWWDGSQEGWAPSVAADEARAEFVQWLREQAYEDGSSPLCWVELSYADDDGITMVLATSADQRNQMRGRENLIRLEIDDPQKTALEWAELDGVVILDPEGWGPLEELPARSPFAPIGRGEFERRLAVSTVVPGRRST